MNLLEIFFQGGMIMYPILLCSLVMVYVAIDRHLTLRKARLDAGQFMMKVRSVFQKGDISALVAFCSQKDAPVANIIRRGVVKHDQGEQRVREAMEDAGREEVYRLEKRLPWLASIAGIAPMLGFLGTVAGMATAFQRIQDLGGVVNPGDLAGGIWAALITTVFGLAIGIPSYALYNYFVTQVARFVHEMEATASELFDLLERKSNEPVPVQRVEPRPATTREPVLVFDDDEYFRRKV